MRYLSLLTLVACLFCWVVVGQTPTGRITGTIVDPSGAAIPGATVDVINTGTGISSSVSSNEAGIYQASFLSPGHYSLSVTAPGFQSYRRQNLVVETAAVLTIDVTMQIGETTETVTVTSETPLLEPDRSSLSQMVESNAVANIPVSTRRVGALLRVLGNVTYVSENLTFGWADMSIAGGRGRQQNWSLDGGSVHGVPMFTGVANANPPMDAIEEVRVEANNYPAEYGRTTGGFIAMTTKSGTNDFKGTLYEYLRNDAFDARNFFASSVAPRKYNVFGGTLGGPVIKNRTHFFFSYEATRRRDGVTRTYAVPTPQEIQGNFSGSSGTPLDPLTGMPFPDGIIPQSRLDRIGSTVASLYPSPNVAGAVSGANNFRTNLVNRQTGDNYVGRVDHTLTDKDRLSVRYLYFRGKANPGVAFAMPEADPNFTNTDVKNANLTPSWTRTITPTLFSESRASILWRSEDTPVPDSSGYAGQLGIPGVDPSGMPRFDILNYTAIGNSNQGRFIGPFRSTQILQSFSWFRGSHSLKFGGEFRRSAVTDNQLSARSGRFNFNDVATGRGFALAALLLGWSQQVRAQSGNVSSRMQYYAGYIQDDWKVNPRLTLNIGLRWEMDTPWYEGFGRRSTFDPLAVNPVSQTLGDVRWQDIDNLTKYAHSFDKNNFGPRFGFAWRPFDDKTVLRGGYGLIYGGIYDGSMGRVFDAGYGDNRSFLSPDNGLTPLYLGDGVPTPPATVRGPGFGAVAAGETPYFTPDMALPDQRNPYSHQANFNIQRQVGNAFMVEVGWLANLSHKIAGRDININEIRPELRGNVQSQALRPYPQYSGVTVRNPNWGNSSYHALSVKVQKRYSSGLSLLSTYTWSKFIDDVQATVEALSSGPQSYYDRHSDKSLSGNDIRHRFTGSFVYDLPFGGSRQLKVPNRVLDAVVRDWSVSGILELRTGFAMGVVEQSNRLNAFSPRQRSNVVGDWKMDSDRSTAEKIQRYFNTAAFAFPGNGVAGNTARNFMTGPGVISLDASLHRDIPIGERVRFQIRGEAYNAFNNVNLSNPNVSRGSSAFGQIGSARDARIVQLGARIEF